METERTRLQYWLDSFQRSLKVLETQKNEMNETQYETYKKSYESAIEQLKKQLEELGDYDKP